MEFNGWTTVDRRTILKDDITHEHLSNIYYYVRFFYPELYPDWTRREVCDLLDTKFNGEILPYKPFWDYEIARIKSKGWVMENGDIVINGFKLGKLIA